MENYINSIFEKQSEQDIKELIYSYCKENGLDSSEIDKLIKKEEEFCTRDAWDGLRYSRGQIRDILTQL